MAKQQNRVPEQKKATEQKTTINLVNRLCIVLAIITCLVYANTLRNDFAVDDVMVLSENKLVKQGFAGIPALFTTHHLEGFGANNQSDYYRPLSLVAFAIEYQFFGLSPTVGHLFNILYFTACVLLLFLFLHHLFREEKIVIAFVASLIFAVHAVHTEVVANIKSRDEIMSFMFSFLALNLLIKYTRQGKTAMLAMGIFSLFLAILSKETAVTFMGILPLVFFFYHNENKKRAAIIVSAMLGVSIIFLLLWNYAQSRTENQETVVAQLTNAFTHSDPDAATSWPPKLLILGTHLKLMLLPYPLNFQYSYGNFVFATWSNAWVVLSLIAYVALIATGTIRLFKYKKDPWAFGILFFLITLALYANIAFPMGQAMANRYDFFPSVGYCLIFALAFDKWILRSQPGQLTALKNPKALAVLLPVLILYSGLTIARNADWKDNFTLVAADLHKSPNDYAMQYKAGLELQMKYNTETDPAMQQQLNNESIVHFLQSIQMNPDYTEAHSDIGVAYMRANKPDSAEYHYKEVLRLNPRHLNASLNLATLYFKKQETDEAIRYYRNTVLIDSNVEMAWYNLGICYAQRQQWDSSLACNKKVIHIAPQTDGYKAYGNAAIMYEMTNQMDSARKYEQLTRKYFPTFHLKSSVQK